MWTQTEQDVATPEMWSAQKDDTAWELLLKVVHEKQACFALAAQHQTQPLFVQGKLSLESLLAPPA
jgi:hypothetical protein